MKFSATKEKLLEGLQQVQNVVSTRTTLPILSNVLLQAKEGAVHLPPPTSMSGSAEVLKPMSTRLAQPPCPRVACSPSFGNCPPAKSPSKLMGRTPLRFAADKAFSKSSACRKRNSRRCQSLKTQKW